MKLFSVLAALMGLSLIAALVAHFGFGAVSQSAAAFGWTGFATICGIHLALIVALGFAWGVLLRGTRAWVPIWGRLVRDSGSEVLPLSQIGGYVLGARAVTFGGVSATVATASTIIDVTLELFAQLAYTAISLFWLFHLRPERAPVVPIAIGLAVAGGVSVAFLRVQHRGFDALDRFARMLGHSWAEKTAAGAAALHTALHDIYRRRTRVWASFGLHLGCWIAITLETWIALRIAGVRLGFSTVLVIESLLYAARSVAFAIPNAVGVQEGAYILLGGGFGLPPETALALSLLKRARDLMIGLPTLVVWQFLESSRLWRSGASPESNCGKAEPRPRLRADSRLL